ncbi:MAG: pyruvate dehydrogenase (acetyl-transferring) E1 component subunit alpha [Myxococcales bacterium]|nr:pyruvate dehydrogenase (acetyl-transferring) E1 component subunit alpha [Myxococcales bacterium]
MSSTTEQQPPAPPTRAADLPGETLLQMYRDMVEQRRFEEFAARAYGMGRIYGFCHLYIGQEAVSVGTARALDRSKGDILVSAYRIHAQALAMGMQPQAAMDELFGRATGCVGGIGGSMHFFDVPNGFWGGWGLVGQQVPMAVGIAFAQRYRQTGAVTMVMFGDGALQQGAIHEAFNMASVWDVPIVFVLENNRFGMGTAFERVSAIDPPHALAQCYGFEHAAFDGMDVLAATDALTGAVERARATSRPYFLEARCSRFRGHSMSDPGKYRTKEQLEEEKAQDPIPKLERVLVERGVATAEALAELDREVKAKMKEVLANAEAAPWPDPSLIHRYTYASPIAQGGGHG